MLQASLNLLFFIFDIIVNVAALFTTPFGTSVFFEVFGVVSLCILIFGGIGGILQASASRK